MLLVRLLLLLFRRLIFVMALLLRFCRSCFCWSGRCMCFCCCFDSSCCKNCCFNDSCNRRLCFYCYQLALLLAVMVTAFKTAETVHLILSHWLVFGSDAAVTVDVMTVVFEFYELNCVFV